MSNGPSATSATESVRTSGPLNQFKPLTTQPATVAPRKPRPLIIEWALAGSATMSACLFTNPMEVIKTRMQVQGELASRGELAPSQKLYRNAVQAFIDVGRREGIRGLQGGLGPSLLYQLTMNGTRLGLYEPIKRVVAQLAGNKIDDVHAPPIFWQNVVSSGISGAFAAFIGSPFFLVKVRLQIQAKSKYPTVTTTVPTPAAAGVPGAAAAAAAPAALAPVGAQHAYTSAWGGLRSIYKADGIAGLFRGAPASMIRVTTGSVVQLSTYDNAKYRVMKYTGWGDGVKVHVSASLLSGFLVAVAMHPPDVISTRLYNQPVKDGKGQLYNSWLDCANKTLKTEGPKGLYKGFVAHYLRLGPHTLLTFLFWEKLKAAAAQAGI